MQFDKSIFALFDRDDFTYRKGDEVTEDYNILKIGISSIDNN